MAETQHKTGQQREGVVTRFAIPALDPHAVDLGRTDRLAKIETVPDENIYGMTGWTHLGTGKGQLGEVSDVLMDKTVEFGYNDHALGPTRRKLASCVPSDRAFPFSGIEHLAYTRSAEKKKAALDGRTRDGWQSGAPFYSDGTASITIKELGR